MCYDFVVKFVRCVIRDPFSLASCSKLFVNQVCNAKSQNSLGILNVTSSTYVPLLTSGLFNYFKDFKRNYQQGLKPAYHQPNRNPLPTCLQAGRKPVFHPLARSEKPQPAGHQPGRKLSPARSEIVTEKPQPACHQPGRKLSPARSEIVTSQVGNQPSRSETNHPGRKPAFHPQ